MAKKHDLQEVLKVGDRLFQTQGYHNTGTDEILKEAAFPRSSFYYHFGSKEGFAMKTLEFYGAYIASFMKQTMLLDDQEKSPLQRLKNYFFHIVNHCNDREFVTCCLVQRFSIEESAEEGPIQKTTHQQYLSWVNITKQCVQEGQEQGEIIATYSPDEIAHYLFSQIYGLSAFARLDRDGKHFLKMMGIAFELIQTQK